MRQPQSWALGEGFPQFSPNPSGVVTAGRRKSISISQHSTGSSQLRDCCWKQHCWVSWSQLPRLSGEDTAEVFCHGGGGGPPWQWWQQRLSPQTNHPTQLQSLDSNYSSPLVYPWLLSLVLSRSHAMSSYLASGLSLFYLTFWPLNSTPVSFQLQAFNLCHSRHQGFYLMHLTVPYNHVHWVFHSCTFLYYSLFWAI